MSEIKLDSLSVKDFFSYFFKDEEILREFSSQNPRVLNKSKYISCKKNIDFFLLKKKDHVLEQMLPINNMISHIDFMLSIFRENSGAFSNETQLSLFEIKDSVIEKRSDLRDLLEKIDNALDNPPNDLDNTPSGKNPDPENWSKLIRDCIKWVIDFFKK